MSSPRFFSGAAAAGGGHHFLDSCFLCKKPLARNVDIFMYRGDAAFCSRECRWEQMDMDEALEKERRRKPASEAAVASDYSGKTRCFAADTGIFAGY